MSRRWAAVLVAVLIATSACARSPAFVTDSSVRITSPASLAVVRPPVEVAWRASPSHAGARYAVFVDRAPIHPGESLRTATDTLCRGNPGCPNADDLAADGIFVTSGHSVVIPEVGPATGVAGEDEPSVHQATVVFIDAAGHRVGEAAFTVDFRVAGSNP